MTTINLINSNYSVLSESTFRMEGNCNWVDNKITSMYLSVHSTEGEYLGTVSYNQMESNNVAFNLDFKYMMDALNQLSVIINDIENELKK